MNKEEIKKIIPYDKPFLWVDEVESIKGKTITGYKNTSPDDDFFKGHFVDMPIMPGVLVIEGIAQLATILLRKEMGDQHKTKHLLAYKVRNASFDKPIFPGDKIKLKAKLLGFYAYKVAHFLGEASVNGEKKCEVRFSVAVVDKEEFKKKQEDSKKESKPKYKLPPLKIKNIEAKLPIIQGGMAVRVSLHNLAGHVAKNGGIGIIAVSGMTDPEEVKEEIRKAREIASPDGVIGINIMGVVSRFKQLVTAAIEEGIDLIIQGAGFRKDVFKLGGKHNVPIFSMASSVKVAKKGEVMGAAAIIIEGKDAGGHLGFPKGHELRKTIDIVKEVVQEVKTPVIAAGGVFNGQDIVEMLRAGAKGVQMATRFVVTEECDVHENFKKAYLEADKEDGAIIHSPVGLPGRVIKNKLAKQIEDDKAPAPDPKKCKNCIGMVCDKSYCILDVLEKARKGDVENGLIFAGSNFWRLKEITTVKELLQELVEEANKILKDKPLLNYD
jgi:NAD(P)H-dependent flavin oxidoreductase YrpB (nitropropane dioxygenase family)/3-hydroxymyristoyl/3-hydroxydecanoyl-(acyl carrier protein) dehydratase